MPLKYGIWYLLYGMCYIIFIVVCIFVQKIFILSYRSFFSAKPKPKDAVNNNADDKDKKMLVK